MERPVCVCVCVYIYIYMHESKYYSCAMYLNAVISLYIRNFQCSTQDYFN